MQLPGSCPGKEANKVAFLAVLAELKYLFLHFKIRKLAADLRFGAGDPALTGQALGVLLYISVSVPVSGESCAGF